LQQLRQLGDIHRNPPRGAGNRLPRVVFTPFAARFKMFAQG
jgi:hypothetical protein